MANCEDISDSEKSTSSSSNSSFSSRTSDDNDKLSGDMSKLIISESDGHSDDVESCFRPEENDSVQVNNRNKNKDYQFIRTYASLMDAKAGVQNREIGEQLWTRGVSYGTHEGDKISYTCRGYPKCGKRMQMLLDPASQDVHVSVSLDAHSHSNNLYKGLNPSTRAKVIELLESGVTKPAKIIKNIEHLNLPAISRLQIANLKARVNKRDRGPLYAGWS